MSEPVSPPPSPSPPPPGRPPPAWGQPPAPDDWRYVTGALPPPTAPASGRRPASPAVGAPAQPKPRRSRATMAMVLSLGGLLLCGAPSVLGMLVARAEIDAMNRGITDSTQRSRAEAAFALGILGTVLLVLTFALWAPMAWVAWPRP